MAAVALACAGAVQAATVIEFSDEAIVSGGPLLGGPQFPAPDGDQSVQIKIEYSGVELSPATSFYSLYRGLYYSWEPTLNELQSNDTYERSVLCSIANGCITIQSPGVARAVFRAPADIGDLASCVLGSPWPCYEHVSPEPSLSFFDAYVVRTGGPAWIRVTIGDLSAVPEPATWAMMITGFGLAGAAMRRRRASLAFA
jgi:hypothetical protein